MILILIKVLKDCYKIYRNPQMNMNLYANHFAYKFNWLHFWKALRWDDSVRVKFPVGFWSGEVFGPLYN